jgi:hypothetical protein
MADVERRHLSEVGDASDELRASLRGEHEVLNRFEILAEKFHLLQVEHRQLQTKQRDCATCKKLIAVNADLLLKGYKS